MKVLVCCVVLAFVVAVMARGVYVFAALERQRTQEIATRTQEIAADIGRHTSVWISRLGRRVDVVDVGHGCLYVASGHHGGELSVATLPKVNDQPCN